MDRRSSRSACSVLLGRGMIGDLRTLLVIGLLPALSTACSKSDSTADKTPDRSPPALDAGEVDLGLLPPKDGFQLRTLGGVIPPGEEHEYCEVARLPGDPTDEYYVSLIELANAPLSHHLALGV